MASKPSLPQGMRDFTAATLRKRDFILSNIRRVFECYGFEPLETPAMENLETLIGKYGEEGDRLIFKVLNNGLSDPKNAEKARTAFEQVMQGKNSGDLTERALKYDLTIPFARFVAMNHAQLTFPFRRYQIQPVWRADRPQKGRYREFTQCDADVVGSRSLRSEVELIHIYRAVFENLGMADVSVCINSRKILTALASVCGGSQNIGIIATAIDKLDKAGLEKVMNELAEKGISPQHIAIIEKYLAISGSNGDKLTALKALIGNDPVGAEGIADLTFLCEKAGNKYLCVDPALARGLDYYTGTILEVRPPESVKMGSIGGGGRYDDLTGLFGVPGIPGVGISFGIDRIYDVMDELDLFPAQIQKGTDALFFNLGEKESDVAFDSMQSLRSAGISCELYHESSKMDKQFKYAEKKNIRYAIIIGSREMESAEAIIKDLSTGKQETVPLKDLFAFFKKAN